MSWSEHFLAGSPGFTTLMTSPHVYFYFFFYFSICPKGLILFSGGIFGGSISVMFLKGYSLGAKIHRTFHSKILEIQHLDGISDHKLILLNLNLDKLKSWGNYY